ncbi:MAG: hypothetical protein PVF85_01920 [Anaerolineales bacterium]
MSAKNNPPLALSGLILVLISVIASGCNLSKTVEADQVATSVAATLGVQPVPIQATVTPTTHTETPTNNMGTVNGTVCYPAEPPLPPLTLYFEDVNSDELIISEHTDGTGSYSIELPPGTYVAYAWREGFELGGSYSEAVPCGLSVSCTDHSLIQFQVPAGANVSDIDICDWYGQPGDVPTPAGLVSPTQTTPTETATAPRGGVSLNCDGTYQRLRITDQGASGKTISVDDWDGSDWVNVWNMASGDPNLRQLTEDAGYYQFGNCQKLVVVPFRSSGPQLWLELSVHAWNGAGLSQVYSNEGYYGEWSKIGDAIRFREASKLGTVNNGPLQACEYITLDYTWNGTDFVQTGSNIETIPNCTVTVQ